MPNPIFTIRAERYSRMFPGEPWFHVLRWPGEWTVYTPWLALVIEW